MFLLHRGRVWSRISGGSHYCLRWVVDGDGGGGEGVGVYSGLTLYYNHNLSLVNWRVVGNRQTKWRTPLHVIVVKENVQPSLGWVWIFF